MPKLQKYPDKICKYCGCSFNRWTKNNKLESASDFKERSFCCQDHAKKWLVGPNHHLFKESGSVRIDGYVRVARDGKRVYLHRWVMEQHLGRKLEKHEHVHHKDENPENNNLDNLELTTNSQHLKEHYAKWKSEGKINENGQFTS